MKKVVASIQNFLQRFNDDPRGWGVLLVLLLGLIGERYHHVQTKHRLLSATKAAAIRESETYGASKTLAVRSDASSDKKEVTFAEYGRVERTSDERSMK